MLTTASSRRGFLCLSLLDWKVFIIPSVFWFCASQDDYYVPAFLKECRKVCICGWDALEGNTLLHYLDIEATLTPESNQSDEAQGSSEPVTPTCHKLG